MERYKGVLTNKMSPPLSPTMPPPPPPPPSPSPSPSPSPPPPPPRNYQGSTCDRLPKQVRALFLPECEFKLNCGWQDRSVTYVFAVLASLLTIMFLFAACIAGVQYRSFSEGKSYSVNLLEAVTGAAIGNGDGDDLDGGGGGGGSSGGSSSAGGKRETMSEAMAGFHDARGDGASTRKAGSAQGSFRSQRRAAAALAASRGGGNRRPTSSNSNSNSNSNGNGGSSDSWRAATGATGVAAGDGKASALQQPLLLRAEEGDADDVEVSFSGAAAAAAAASSSSRGIISSGSSVSSGDGKTFVLSEDLKNLAHRLDRFVGRDGTAGASLIFRNLCYRYRGRLLLRGVSGYIKTGSLVAVIGAPDSGATTLLRCIAGRAPEVGELTGGCLGIARPVPLSLPPPPLPARPSPSLFPSFHPTQPNLTLALTLTQPNSARHRRDHPRRRPRNTAGALLPYRRVHPQRGHQPRDANGARDAALLVHDAHAAATHGEGAGRADRRDARAPRPLARGRHRRR